MSLESGERAPNFSLTASEGEKVASADLLARGNLVIYFLRSFT